MEDKRRRENEDKPSVDMVGEDGNAFAILGRCRRAMRRHYNPTEFAERWAAFEAEATSGDYDHLLRTVMEHFEVD